MKLMSHLENIYSHNKQRKVSRVCDNAMQEKGEEEMSKHPFKYDCGHTTTGAIIMDCNALSYAAYSMWAEEDGNLKSQKECFPCWIKRTEKVKE